MIGVERHFRTEAEIADLTRHRDNLYGIAFGLPTAATQDIFNLYADAARYLDEAIRKLKAVAVYDLETALSLSIATVEEEKERCAEVASEGGGATILPFERSE
jgi:hypothetical protein